MCHDLDSRPPIPPLAGAAVDGERLELTSQDGTRFTGFHARPSSPSGAAMLILPDVRGLHPFYEELPLRFAEAGIEALSIDYFGRTAPPPPRGADFEHNPHVEQTSYATVLQDITAARDFLVARPDVRTIFSVGFCYGGRLAFLTAAREDLGLSGGIGFYGIVAGPGRVDLPAPADNVRVGQAPVLGLFGGADEAIPQDSIETYRRALDAAGVDSELVTYPGAPHSFFDRKAVEFADASADAWTRTLEFVRRQAAID
ncbi:MAG TPA: dienelactone hydrolase family protein [Candidatus Limnocylindrales bacterium]|nr:dienelactone hydrolase family protein [Candidatus Limnocylindrales bacterium]